MDTAMLEPLFEQHALNISAFKAVDSRLAAVEGDRDKAIKAWIESSDDPDAVKLREAIAEANRRLKLLAESSVQSEDLSEDDKAKLKAEHATLKDKVRAGTRGLQKLADAFSLDVTERLKEMGDPTLRAAGSSSTPSGSGLPRASVNVTVFKQHEPDTKWEFVNLGSAADHVGLPVEEMQKLYAEAGGVAHEDIKTIKVPTEFTYQDETKPNSSVWVIKTVPKETAPRGRKPVEPKTPKDPNELPAAS